MARAVKLDARYWMARARALAPHQGRSENPPVFIMGCGRSGTTILGEILGCHPNVSYQFEPYHTWAAVDSITDASNLFGSNRGSIFLREQDCTIAARNRFRRLFRASGQRQLIEKTPHNALRIQYLDALVPGARFIHIVRDGIDVVESIKRVAVGNNYHLYGRNNFNSWWGANDYKWMSLRDGGIERGYFADEVHHLHSHSEKGAYEWLVSLLEVDRCRGELGDRLLEVRFEDIGNETANELCRIAEFAGVNAPLDWLRRAVALVEDRSKPAEMPVLPEAMQEQFAAYRSKFGYGEARVTRKTA